MKELHNHIFSNTTCISKENMLKYINNQLSKKELHEVEKHLLGCEFCSEAVEGLKYAENSSIIFALDHQIDQRTKGSTSSSMYRGLMVAALGFSYSFLDRILHSTSLIKLLANKMILRYKKKAKWRKAHQLVKMERCQ